MPPVHGGPIGDRRNRINKLGSRGSIGSAGSLSRDTQAEYAKTMIADKLYGQYVQAYEMFKGFDKSSTGSITAGQLRDGLLSLEVGISESEVASMLRETPLENNMVNYVKFLQNLAVLSEETQLMSSPRSPAAVSATPILEPIGGRASPIAQTLPIAHDSGRESQALLKRVYELEVALDQALADKKNLIRSAEEQMGNMLQEATKDIEFSGEDRIRNLEDQVQESKSKQMRITVERDTILKQLQDMQARFEQTSASYKLALEHSRAEMDSLRAQVSARPTQPIFDAGKLDRVAQEVRAQASAEVKALDSQYSRALQEKETDIARLEEEVKRVANEYELNLAAVKGDVQTAQAEAESLRVEISVLQGQVQESSLVEKESRDRVEQLSSDMKEMDHLMAEAVEKLKAESDVRQQTEDELTQEVKERMAAAQLAERMSKRNDVYRSRLVSTNVSKLMRSRMHTAVSLWAHETWASRRRRFADINRQIERQLEVSHVTAMDNLEKARKAREESERGLEDSLNRARDRESEANRLLAAVEAELDQAKRGEDRAVQIAADMERDLQGALKDLGPCRPEPSQTTHMSVLEVSLVFLRRGLADVVQKWQSQVRRCEDLEMQNAASSEQNRMLAEKLGDVGTRASEQMQEILDTSNDRVAKLNAKMDELAQTASNARSSEEAAHGKVQYYETKLQQVQADLVQVRGENASLAKRVVECEEVMQRAQTRRDTLEERCRDLDTNKNDMMEQISRLQIERDGAVKRLEEAKMEVERLNTLVRNKEDTLVRMEKELSVAKVTLTTLQEDVETQARQASDTQLSCDEAKREAQHANEGMVAAKQRIQDLEDELMEVKSQEEMRAMSGRFMQNDVAQLKVENKEILERHGNEMNQLSNRLSEAEERAAEVASHRDKLLKVLEVLERQRLIPEDILSGYGVRDLRASVLAEPFRSPRSTRAQSPDRMLTRSVEDARISNELLRTARHVSPERRTPQATQVNLASPSSSVKWQTASPRMAAPTSSSPPRSVESVRPAQPPSQPRARGRLAFSRPSGRTLMDVSNTAMGLKSHMQEQMRLVEDLEGRAKNAQERAGIGGVNLDIHTMVHITASKDVIQRQLQGIIALCEQLEDMMRRGENLVPTEEKEAVDARVAEFTAFKDVIDRKLAGIQAKVPMQ